MPALNPHTFPLVPLSAPAPEAAPRAGMGGWEPFGLTSPSDRLLPFVLARRASPLNAPWVSCAWVLNVETGEKLAVLEPVGARPLPFVVPDYGLVLTKLLAGVTEYFTYDGALIPLLALPCGVPLRLIVDNAYQSPLFYAVASAAQLPLGYLPLSWYHDGPLGEVPYGRGFRQVFYLNNGALKQLDARREQTVSKAPDTGQEVIEALSLYNQVEAVINPVPAYLQQALSGAQAPKFFLADGQPWKLLTVKSAPSGSEGGRWSLTLTLEDQTPIVRQGCQAGPLTTEPYDGTPARGWRCGDTSDTTPDYRPTGVFSCEVSGTKNTGYVNEVYRDLNPFSASYRTEEARRSASQDLVRCPLPVVYNSVKITVYATKNDCGSGLTGSREAFEVPAGAYQSEASQADADAQALAYANDNAQDNANSAGTCQSDNGSSNYRPLYTEDGPEKGCFTCRMYNVNDISDVRDATPDEQQMYRVEYVNNSGLRQCPICN